MQFKFDIYDRMETPELVLCEISRHRICTLKALNIVMDLNFTDISAIKFNIPMLIDGEKYLYYDDVVDLRMIYVNNIGWFQLTQVVKQSDGIETYKECTALSAESMFKSKRMTGVIGEFKLYDPLNPYESLMGILLTMAPDWKVGTVDGTVLTRQRSINITEQDLYSMMTSDFYTAYECIFVFNYDKFEINIYDANKTFKDTEIFLSYHNLLKETTVTPQTDNIITALKVIGGDGLDISGVNPNGSDTIYNVNYFKDRMSQELQDALSAYEQKYSDLKPAYSDLLVEYKNKNTELAQLQSNAPQYDVSFLTNQDGTAIINPLLTSTSGLAQLEGLRKNLEGIRSVRISHGNIPYSDVNGLISTVESMIVNKVAEIEAAVNGLQNLATQISDITLQLKMENNFTDEQWIELNGYFRYDTLQENSYVITDIMTQEEKQEIRQELYDFGSLVLEKSCVPKYVFEISSVNFLALIEFEKFREQFELGTTFTLKINDDYVVKPLLLGVHINFDDPSDFKLKYGNKTKLDDGFDFSAFKQAVGMGANLSFDLVKIEAMKKQKDEVTQFMSGALDIARNNLFTDKNKKEILIDDNGMRFKEYDYDTGALLPYELWVTGKQIVFSNDNFTTAKMAIGEITAPGLIGGKVYGIVADALIGHIVATNELHVSNENNNFRLDETGAWLNNANFTLTKGSGANRNTIVLDPNTGFAIYKGELVDDNRQIYLGSDGNCYFKGQINGGSININNRFIVDSAGNVNIGQGAATINNYGYAVFQDIHIRNASSLDLGYYDSNGIGVKIQNGVIYARGGVFSGEIVASIISGGTINGAIINGGTIRGGRYYSLTGEAYVEIANGSMADFTLRGSGGENRFQIFDYGGSLSIRSYGTEFIHSGIYGTTAAGAWSFSGSLSVDGKNVYSSLNNLEWEVSYQNTRINNNDSSISALSGRVSTVESRLGSLESRVSSLEGA